MKTSKFLFSAIMCFLLVSSTYGQTTYSFNDGLNAAKSGNKKIFLYIYSPSDSWSKKTDSEVFSSDIVKKALADFVFIKLNADGQDKFSYNKKDYTSTELAKMFGGTGYPTFVFMNSDGSIIDFKYNQDQTSNISGFLGVDDLADMLDFFSQNKYRDTDLSKIFSD